MLFANKNKSSLQNCTLIEFRSSNIARGFNHRIAIEGVIILHAVVETTDNVDKFT